MTEFFQGIYWLLVCAFFFYSTAVALFDLKTRRIENRLIGVGLVIGLSAALCRSLILGSTLPVLSAIGGMLICFGIYFLIHLVRNNQFGAGDVKLATVVGAFIGSLGLAESILAVLGGFVLALPAAVFFILRGNPAFRLPFAPFLLGSCWLVFVLYNT